MHFFSLSLPLLLSLPLSFHVLCSFSFFADKPTKKYIYGFIKGGRLWTTLLFFLRSILSQGIKVEKSIRKKCKKREKEIYSWNGGGRSTRFYIFCEAQKWEKRKNAFFHYTWQTDSVALSHAHLRRRKKILKPLYRAIARKPIHKRSKTFLETCFLEMTFFPS